METTPPPTGDRRPIASRNLPIWQRTAALLAKIGLSANAISILGMFAGLLAAITLLLTTYTTSQLHTRLLFAASAALIQLRLLANMLDGMVAVLSHKTSLLGELFNELPDRISDTAILIAAGYALTSTPSLGYLAAILALFVTYIRALGKTMAVPNLFQGPMSKSHRMFTLTCACLLLTVLPYNWLPFIPTSFSPPLSLMSLTLLLIILGTLLTAYRRLSRIIQTIKNSP